MMTPITVPPSRQTGQSATGIHLPWLKPKECGRRVIVPTRQELSGFDLFRSHRSNCQLAGKADRLPVYPRRRATNAIDLESRRNAPRLIRFSTQPPKLPDHPKPTGTYRPTVNQSESRLFNRRGEYSRTWPSINSILKSRRLTIWMMRAAFHRLGTVMNRRPVRLQYARNLGNRGSIIRYVLNSFGTNHRVEARGAIGQLERIGLDERDIGTLQWGKAQKVQREIDGVNGVPFRRDGQVIVQIRAASHVEQRMELRKALPRHLNNNINDGLLGAAEPRPGAESLSSLLLVEVATPRRIHMVTPGATRQSSMRLKAARRLRERPRATWC
jgi:hypothetical protein